MKGTIEEVSTNGEYRQFRARIGKKGFEDDQSGTPGIVLLNSSVMHCISRWPGGVQLLAGQLGENILVKDIGNITVLPPGTLIKIGSKIVLRVEYKARHYRKMFSHFPEEILRLLDRRGGIICSVVEGVGEWVCDFQEIEVLPKEELKGAA